MRLATAARGVFLGLLFLISSSHENLVAAAPQNERVIIPHEPIDGTVSEIWQAYRFAVKAGDYFQFGLQKLGTDIEVTLSGTHGELVRSISCSHRGSLQISEIASTPGAYLVKLRSC